MVTEKYLFKIRISKQLKRYTYNIKLFKKGTVPRRIRGGL